MRENIANTSWSFKCVLTDPDFVMVSVMRWGSMLFYFFVPARTPNERTKPQNANIATPAMKSIEDASDTASDHISYATLLLR
jgi:hypothetical protein